MNSPLFLTDYIDTVFGGPSLWPTDPYKKAVDQLLLEDFGSKVRIILLLTTSATLHVLQLSIHNYIIISPTLFQFIPNYYKFYRNAADDSTVTIVQDFLRQLNDVVKSHPGGFMSEGDSPGAVDYLIWPWLERYGALKIIAPRKFVTERVIN